MKNTMKLLVLAALLMSANPAAVFADGETVNIGGVTAQGPNGTAVVGNVTGINNNTVTGTVIGNASGYGGNSNAAGGDSKVINSNLYTSPLQAVGFVNTTVAGSGPLSVAIADPLIAPFRNGFGKNNLGNVIAGVGGDTKWENICENIEIEGDNTLSFSEKLPPTQWAAFAFAGEGSAPGPSSKSVRSGTYSISIKKGNVGILLARIYQEAMNDGASMVYVTGLDNYAAKSKTNALSIVGAAVSACTLNVVPAGSIGGGSVENKKTSVSVSFSTYRIVQQPMVQPVSYQPQPVERLEEVVKFCPYPCYNNASLRKQLADAQAKSGNFSEAIKNYEIAQRDILAGKEPSGKKTVTMQAGLELLKVVRYNQLYSILKTAGEKAEISQAQAWGFNSMPDSANDLKN
jgi:hypothetical protein